MDSAAPRNACLGAYYPYFLYGSFKMFTASLSQRSDLANSCRDLQIGCMYDSVFERKRPASLPGSGAWLALSLRPHLILLSTRGANICKPNLRACAVFPEKHCEPLSNGHVWQDSGIADERTRGHKAPKAKPLPGQSCALITRQKDVAGCLLFLQLRSATLQLPNATPAQHH